MYKVILKVIPNYTQDDELAKNDCNVNADCSDNFRHGIQSGAY